MTGFRHGPGPDMISGATLTKPVVKHTIKYLDVQSVSSLFTERMYTSICLSAQVWVSVNRLWKTFTQGLAVNTRASVKRALEWLKVWFRSYVPKRLKYEHWIEAFDSNQLFLLVLFLSFNFVSVGEFKELILLDSVSVLTNWLVQSWCSSVKSWQFLYSSKSSRIDACSSTLMTRSLLGMSTCDECKCTRRWSYWWCMNWTLSWSDIASFPWPISRIVKWSMCFCLARLATELHYSLQLVSMCGHSMLLQWTSVLRNQSW